MKFRDREKQRLVPLKRQLFTAAACDPGNYNGIQRDFCLCDTCSGENLHASVREKALAYFGARGIRWHDGFARHKKEDLPSNHLCCSQSFCVNAWFPFWQEPDRLRDVLVELGYPVKRMLPFDADSLPALAQHGFRIDNALWHATNETGYVAFEWIGLQNYLREGVRGVVAGDVARTRGANSTSADFAIRFLREDGGTQIVLGEWKYTEEYANDASKRYGNADKHGVRTDRSATYRPLLSRPNCQIALGPELSVVDLMYDPFDQMMRAQLLASGMEEAREMDANVVSYLHVSPRANGELNNRITAPRLRDIGRDIHAVWKTVLRSDRFKHVYAEVLLDKMLRHTPDSDWAAWMRSRYGDIK